MTSMKESMKSKDQTSLRALRAIKSAIIVHKTQKGSSDEITNEDELKILQKLVKQRKELKYNGKNVFNSNRPLECSKGYFSRKETNYFYHE